jgi:hypothetical protein
VSLDEDIGAWRAAIKKYEIDKPYLTNHFRIGPKGDAINLFDMQTIPRYLLINKKGFFVDQNAKRPSDPRIENDIEQLLAEPFEK